MVSRINLRLIGSLLIVGLLVVETRAQSRRPQRPAAVPRMAMRQPPPGLPDGPPEPLMPPDDNELDASLGGDEMLDFDESGSIPDQGDPESDAGEPGSEEAPESDDAESLVDQFGEENWIDEEEIAPGLLEEEFLHSTGSCGEEGCDRCRNWYSRVDFTLYHRTRVREDDLVRSTVAFINPLTGLLQQATFGVLGTKEIQFVLTPGARFTVGRYLGRDATNRDHMLEASYMGFSNWSGDALLTLNRLQTQTTVVDLLTGTAQTFRYVGTLGQTDFPSNANRGFDSANLYTYGYSSSLHDLQFNRRIRRGLRRTRLVYMPGGWTQQISPGLTPSLLGGLRFLQIYEHANFHAEGQIDNPEVSTGTDVDGNPTNFVPYGVGGNFTGDYDQYTYNRLFGAQVGGDLTQQFDRWNYGFQIRTGLYSNFASQQGTIIVNDPVTFRETQFPQNNVAYGAKSRSLAFVGELGFQYSYNINRYATFRTGYNLMWVTGLALAPENFNFTGTDRETVNRGGRIMYQGLNLGLEIVF